MVGDFDTHMRPPGDSVATPSVNVPPISTATRRLFCRLSWGIKGLFISASAFGATGRISIGDGNEPFLGHFADGIGWSLAAEAAVLDAAERHHIDAGAGGFIDVHAAEP